MDITGKIFAICPQQGGTSKAGKDWKSQTFVLETEEQYPRKVAFELFGAKLDEFGSMCQQGAKLTVSFDIESREYQGRWYTSVRAWRVATATDNKPAPAAEDPIPADPLSSMPKDDDPFGAPAEKSNDLPFF
ncbi:MAG: DUF3127 domain-containing protein [Paludibacteraceae bacterium]|nr:DUF3127 domain-containing protein [Paludibacteraceae bacterium]